MSYLILAQSEVTARALGAWLELLGEEPLEDAGKRLKDRRVMLAREMTGYPGGFVRCFKQVAAGLARELDGCAAGEAVVLVDSIRPAGLNAVGSARRLGSPSLPAHPCLSGSPMGIRCVIRGKAALVGSSARAGVPFWSAFRSPV